MGLATSKEASVSATASPEIKQIVNGWHAGSRALNITVRGDTPEDAKRRFADAVKKAAELRSRPDHFANPS